MYSRIANVLLLAVITVATVRADEVNLVHWSESYGAGSSESTTTIAVDAEANVIVAGRFDGELTIGTTTFVNTGEEDLFVAKLDPDGEPLWARAFSAGGVVRVIASDVDAAGNIALGGNFSGTLDVDGTLYPNAGGLDAFLIVLGPTGQVQWARCYGADDSQTFRTVAFDDIGLLYAAGFFGDQIEFGDGQSYASEGEYDAMIARFVTATGDCVSSRHWGHYGNQYIVDMAIAPDGDLLLAFEYDHTFYYSVWQEFPNAGGTDVCIWRLNSLYDLQSAVHFGDEADQYSGDVATDLHGNVFATGKYSGTITVNGQTIEGDGDAYLIKFDEMCEALWLRDIHSYGTLTSPRIVTGSVGDLLISGSFFGTIYFDDSHSHASPIENDVYLAKYSPLGECRFSADWGSNHDEQYVWALAIGPGDEIALGGQFMGTLDFPDHPLQAAGGFDAWVALMSVRNIDEIQVMADFYEWLSIVTSPIPDFGTPFPEAFRLGGGTADATIGVRLVSDGQPIVGYPAEDIWLDGPTGGLAFCAAGNTADAATDTQGYTEFAQPLVGGGWMEAESSSLRVTVGGAAIDHPDIPLSVNSPDLNGDLRVNLSDIAVFTQDYFGGYAYRSDFTYDQTINLSDISIFTTNIGAACPRGGKNTTDREVVGTIALSFARDRIEPTIDLAVGHSHEAFLLASLPAGEVPVAWDFRLETSANLRVDSCEPIARGLDLGEAPRHVVGAPAADVVRAGDRTVLMRLVVTPTASGPASLYLRSGVGADDRVECALQGHDEPRALLVENLAGGAAAAIGAEGGDTPAATHAALSCYPNPFNPSTTIAFALEVAGEARIVVHDANGRVVRSFDLGRLPAGVGEVTWQGADDSGRPVASGIYLARLTVDGRPYPELVKMALLK